ncbi:alpha/beta fold hydrolase [Paenibacillus sp. FSL R7-0179]|uniref:alpha/beta fold hydrolase n=1 Tax=Paenibacillus sp. FSL R7-0179 TaxID=2921672 RepID=UPI0030FA2394
MSTYSRMQLLKLVENQQMSPEEALKIIRESSTRPSGMPVQPPQKMQEEPLYGAASPPAPAERLSSAGSLNKLLAEGVSALLKVPADKIRPDDDWKSFGFDSISFTGFHSFLTERLGFSFPLDSFFEYSTINSLSGYLLASFPEAAGQDLSGAANVQDKEQVSSPSYQPEESPRAPQDSLWLVNSADRFFLDFWSKLDGSSAASAKTGYQTLSVSELDRVPHKYIQVLVNTSAGQKIEAVISGKGKPLVIVGGVGMASPMILHQLDYFSSRCRVISIHNPGCGLSEAIEDYSLEHRVQVIAEVLDRLGVTEAADVIGISWGGMIGQTFSVMYPERVSSLILVSSIYEIVNENPQMDADSAMRKDLEAVDRGLDSLELMEYGKSIDKQIFTKYMEYYLPGNHRSYSTAGLLGRIRVPVLIICGRKDTIINTRQSAEMAAAIPGAHSLELADAAHFLFMTHHGELNRAVEEFIFPAEPAPFRLQDNSALLKDKEELHLLELDIKGIEGYAGLEDRLNELCMSYAYRYISQCGFDTSPGAVHDRTVWVKQLKLLPAYSRLLDSMIGMLAEDGVVRLLGSRLQFIKPEAEIPEPQQLYEACLEDYPDFRGMLRFLDYCCAHYKEALSGAIPPVSVLFPKGSAEALEQSNRDTAEHGRERVYARVTHDILASLISKARSGKPVHILEIGGGTGLLTRQLLDLAALPNVNYCFTDIGEYFITKAKDNPDFKALHFRTFDISKNPADQGLALHSFDAVVGLNVVHATRDIGVTLEHLRQVLVPGGLLMLIEACQRRRWVDLVWGLAEGWWLFEDRKLRDSSPIIDPYAWEQAFADAGYHDIHLLPGDDERRFMADCILIAGHRR